MEERSEVCFKEEVERMRRSGMSEDEIAQTMGVDPNWVGDLISLWEGEKNEPEGDEG